LDVVVAPVDVVSVEVVSVDPVSVDPVSVDPVSVDPVSVDTLSVSNASGLAPETAVAVSEPSAKTAHATTNVRTKRGRFGRCPLSILDSSLSRCSHAPRRLPTCL
jgi:hypothetical protein